MLNLTFRCSCWQLLQDNNTRRNSETLSVMDTGCESLYLSIIYKRTFYYFSDDKNIERREQVRFKVERYLLRAEKIYNLYLSPEIKQINELVW